MDRKRFFGCMGFLLTAALTACGGGGGGDAGGLSYDGLTTPAAITTSNGQLLAAQALNAGDIGASSTTFVASQQNIETTSGAAPDWFDMLRVFRHISDDLNNAQTQEPSTARATITQILDEPGDCGGKVTGSLTFNNATNAISGKVTFSAYCVEAVTISGGAEISGLYDPASDNFENLTIDFNTLSVVTSASAYAGVGDYTMDGTVKITNNSATEGDVLINTLLRNDISGETFKSENIALHWQDNTTLDYSDVSITGRFYHPAHGYVDITTPTALRYAGNDDWPSSGVFKITGASSGATLTALSNTTYQMEIDVNGDGASDSTTTGLWSGLGSV